MTGRDARRRPEAMAEGRAGREASPVDARAPRGLPALGATGTAGATPGDDRALPAREAPPAPERPVGQDAGPEAGSAAIEAPPPDLAHAPDALARLAEAVRRAAPEWGLSPRTRVRLLNVSENATFLAEDPEAPAPLVVRVHRPGYHTAREIASELAWIEAIRRDGAARAAAPVARRDGRLAAPLPADEGARLAVAFAFVPGAEPAPSADLAPDFARLGAITARLHLHARAWRRPDWFARKRWDFETTLGARALWGDWRAAPGLTPEARAALERASDALRAALAAYGDGADRFGLIHADLRLANLLVCDDAIAVIDFDDCGFGWFAYDFAAAISFIEREPWIPALQEAWLEGYARVAPLPPGMRRIMPAMIMLRRMLLTAWLGTHAQSDTARALGPGFAEGTAAMAERFLRGEYPAG
ncbi:phosphotransferase enzyme family protein [Oceanicella actignis]|uniref:phosphotransferase enzyme family protein n=1 Tax=Oceanicella actignis TaxID=1189325 RepID=UPI001255AAEC|nr:phosphotransferase [Oceanicella actignis]TYO91234.1 Ser/Thr protein kinase RdoA (MazF antagonist) [Oceanicella actignis]